MASKISKIKHDKILYLIGILIIIILLVINANLSKKQENNNRYLPQEEMTEEQAAEYENENAIAKLKDMKERDRMEYYFSVFLDYVEGQEYEKAYDLLYEDFKTSYFPTLESFKKYIPTVFSEMSNIEHENIERNGDVYVLWLSITDALNGKPGDKKQMNIVIKENDYNDFVLSFSVI